MSKCKVDGCERDVSNKETGLCHMHHLRYIRTGTTERKVVDKSKKCSAPGCTRMCQTKELGDYCLMHYKRLKNTGSLELHPKPGKKYCKICGIEINNRNGSAKGLCSRHYRSLNLYGDPTQIDKNKQLKKEHINTHGYYGQVNRTPRHRHIIEEHIGRKLATDEVVHHINMDKLDNRIENLHVCSKKEHQKLHIELQLVAAELVKRGIIKFENGHYSIV